MASILDTAQAILTTLGTKVQSLIDAQHAYDLAGAQDMARTLQGDISAGSMHLQQLATQVDKMNLSGVGASQWPPPTLSSPKQHVESTSEQTAALDQDDVMGSPKTTATPKHKG
jgi:hypothetical protein